MTDNKDIMDKVIKDDRMTICGLYDQSFLKAEKLASALYMVTDFLSDSEPLKWKLRSRSIDLLTDISKLLKDTERLRGVGLDQILIVTNELISLLSVAYIGGAVSKMNFEILKQEYEILAKQIFETGSRRPLSQFLLSGLDSGERTLVGAFVRKLETENSFNSAKTLAPISFEKRVGTGDLSRAIGQKDNKKDTSNDLYGLNSKDGKKSIRKEQIVSWLKDKSWTSIAEIAKALPDCGSKTVQRELLELVSLGVLKKQGERRWSRYMLA